MAIRVMVSVFEARPGFPYDDPVRFGRAERDVFKEAYESWLRGRQSADDSLGSASAEIPIPDPETPPIPDVRPDRFRWGLLVGANFSNVHYGDPDFQALVSPSTLVGLRGGVFVKLPLGRQLRVRAEMNYGQRGILVFDSTLRFHDLQLPVLIEIQLGGESMWVPRLLAGPYVLTTLSASLEGFPNADSSLDPDNPEFGFIGGIEFPALRAGSAVVVLGGRYEHGITDRYPGGVGFYLRNWAAYVGVLLGP